MTRNDKLFRAIYIGVLALMEDRLSAFLAKISNQLGTELESLKLIFDMKKELFYKSAVKGLLAEDEIADFLNNYFLDRSINDKAILVGNKTGNLPKNKTGDIICEVENNPKLTIGIEVKFDKSIKLGDISSRDILTKKMETAWNQLLETQANRDSKISIIVFDISLVDNSILKIYDNVGFIPQVGFITIIDSQKGDYSNLAIAYMLSRDIVINSKDINLDSQLLSIILKRIIKDINEILKIRSLVESNIENNKNILKQIEKSILLAEFNMKYLSKFLNDGILNTKDMFDFYSGEEIKENYSLIEKEIEKLT